MSLLSFRAEWRQEIVVIGKLGAVLELNTWHQYRDKGVRPEYLEGNADRHKPPLESCAIITVYRHQPQDCRKQ